MSPKTPYRDMASHCVFLKDQVNERLALALGWRPSPLKYAFIDSINHQLAVYSATLKPIVLSSLSSSKVRTRLISREPEFSHFAPTLIITKSGSRDALLVHSQGNLWIWDLNEDAVEQLPLRISEKIVSLQLCSFLRLSAQGNQDISQVVAAVTDQGYFYCMPRFIDKELSTYSCLRIRLSVTEVTKVHTFRASSDSIYFGIVGDKKFLLIELHSDANISIIADLPMERTIINAFILGKEGEAFWELCLVYPTEVCIVKYSPESRHILTTQKFKVSVCQLAWFFGMYIDASRSLRL